MLIYFRITTPESIIVPLVQWVLTEVQTQERIQNLLKGRARFFCGPLAKNKHVKVNNLTLNMAPPCASPRPWIRHLPMSTVSIHYVTTFNIRYIKQATSCSSYFYSHLHFPSKAKMEITQARYFKNIKHV